MSRAPLSNTARTLCGQSTQSNVPVSGKQHFTISSNRPLFEIRESDDVVGGLPDRSIDTGFPSVSRELLLGLYSNSSNRVVTRSLFTFKPEPGTVSHTSAQPDISPEKEKQYLQSLVQFRALRSSGLNHATWEQWNEEARRILNGANIVRCTGVATEVFDTILSAGVLPDCETFTLLVRTSVNLGEFAPARTFLTEMTNAGFLPPRTLVDEVSKGLHAPSTIGSSTFNKHAPEFVPSMTQALYARDLSSTSIRE